MDVVKADMRQLIYRGNSPNDHPSLATKDCERRTIPQIKVISLKDGRIDAVQDPDCKVSP